MCAIFALDDIRARSHFVLMTPYSSTDTIGGLLDDNGYTLTAHCGNKACGHHVRLDLAKLAEKLGRDHGAMAKDLLHKMHCSVCKSRFLRSA
ncbi:hypothetical protein J2X72_003906 [Phyllobacterium sp. 1468]|nr:hypothetical protein [Phyllobacterium sp. 1468]